jgi:hypothetical protein
MTIPNPNLLTFTRGVYSQQGVGFKTKEDDYMFPRFLSLAVKEAFNKEPDECTDGGNNKFFFTVIYRDIKYFVAANEVGGLTVMLPDEY